MASVELNLISCQYQPQQHFPSSSHYEIHQHHNHPQIHPQEQQQQYHDYRQPSQPLKQNLHGSFEFDKFNQQAKQLQAQVHFYNQQQHKHIQQQINNVHQESSQPQFDFAVNRNYSDLEKASEQFVTLGSLAGKQNSPAKVIKITKTVAVKQPVPVPYPVPVVKVVKEQVLAENAHHSYHTHLPTTKKPSHFLPSSFYNYTSYTHPTPTPAGPSNAYIHQQSLSPSQDEFDTEPFYVTTPQKETIKFIPVPYFVDEHGNKHEISSQHDALTSSNPPSGYNAPSSFTAPSSQFSPSSHDESFYPGQQTHDESGKFQSFSFNYHPPTQHNQLSHQHQSHNQPETKYHYNRDSENSASSNNPASYETSEENNEHQHYQYKYVSYK